MLFKRERFGGGRQGFYRPCYAGHGVGVVRGCSSRGQTAVYY